MKHIIRLSILTLLLSVFHPVNGLAQEKMSMTIDQAIGIGLENSKGLHASAMRVQAAESKSGEVQASQLPTLKASGSYNRLSDIPAFQATIPQDAFGRGFPARTISVPLSQTILNNYGLRLSLQQPLFTGMRLKSSSEMADFDAQATGENYNRDRSELVFNIKNAYWGLYEAIEFKKVIDENIEQVQAHLNNVQNLSKQGIVTKNEVLKVEVQLSSARVMQLTAQNNVHLAMLALSNLIGLPLTTEIRLASDIQTRSAGESEINKLVQQAVETRPEVKSMEYRVKSSESAVTLARSGWFPQVYLTGNYYYARPNQRINPAVDEFKDTWDVGISLSLDIWNWGTTVHQTNQAQAHLAEAQAEMGQLKDAINLEVTQSYLNMNESRERIGVAETGVREAEENYRITNEKFKAGLALNSDLLDAEAALLQAKWSHIQALVDHEVAQARLDKAVGTQG
jgi:outer membrane protein TolC